MYNDVKTALYRVDIYTGPFTYDGLLSREYKRFKCVDDAKVYAYEKMQATAGAHDYDILRVQNA